jgi:hypothetical protein
VKGVLENGAAPFANRNPVISPQGSYGNDTNVARDSDVDVVAFIETTFAHDANTLSGDQHREFQRAYPGEATYTYANYKQDVAQWLARNFGAGVRLGRKAIYVPANQNRRECDVLPAIEYRYYYEFVSINNQSYVSGICFYLPDGTQIVNFPKQHADNCTEKHQRTNSRFKPTVRIYKNIRNYLVGRNVLQDGVAPSYFIEGMLYNAPNELFGGTWSDTIVATFNHIWNTDRSEFYCANGIHRLLGNSQVAWPAANCNLFLDAVSHLWGNWQ